jgi:hypothetical protein
MDFGKVFISSIINPSIDDLKAERLAVREVVESFPFLKAWAFEATPASSENLDQSYLRHVEEGDAFVILFGAKVTPPVNAEWLRAKKLKKPILAFVKSVSNRTAEVDDALDALNKKYAPFKTIEELKRAAKLAIEQTIVLGLRSLSMKSAILSIKDTLQEFAEHKTHVQVAPLVPLDAHNSFYVEEVQGEVVVLKKTSNIQSVDIPLSRVAEVLPAANNDLAVLALSGRLQWTTLPQRWKFFPDAAGESPLGLGKMSSPQSEYFTQIRGVLEARRIQSCWDWVKNLGDRIGAGWEVFYDEDGRYFRYMASPSEQIFMILHPRA